MKKNSKMKVVEFDHFRIDAGLTSFVLSSGKWVEKRNVIGIASVRSSNE